MRRQRVSRNKFRALEDTSEVDTEKGTADMGGAAEGSLMKEVGPVQESGLQTWQEASVNTKDAEESDDDDWNDFTMGSVRSSVDSDTLHVSSQYYSANMILTSIAQHQKHFCP